jgi:5-methylcytosine-specific restriction endonuclease McrA
MCRGKTSCDVLGIDPEKWSKTHLLQVPEFFEEALETFSFAIRELVSGDQKKSLERLNECKSELVGNFFIEHGQQSAYFRVRNKKQVDLLNKAAKSINPSPRLLPKVEKLVFLRDSYRCRYCGLRIISKEVFSEYSRIVGPEYFSVERENSKRNGLTLGLRGVADHVEPFASGGLTEIENLVTSCYSCNFGKAGYTLDQLGIEDPRLRPPMNDGWQGLTEYLPTLKKLSRDNSKTV